MSATSFQRMRRVQALRELAKEQGIEGFDTMSEAELQQALGPQEETEPEKETFLDAELAERELRAKAKDLGIKSWHVKSVETLTAEIAEITDKE